MEIQCINEAGLPEAARRFVEATGARGVFAFRGPMGAGKTTFIAEVCRRLGCREEAASPTFSIVNEYLDADGLPVYHFDFYRLESPQEALDIGVEDYFYSGRPCFIEWPERIGSLLPPDAVEVTIEEMPGGSRRITLP